MREERLAAVWARMRRFQGTGDHILLLEPQALAEHEQLMEHLRAPSGDLDLEVCHALGWFHWNRYTAVLDLPGGEENADLGVAVQMLTPCFFAGAGEDFLPRPLLPLLAEGAAPRASDLLRQALDSTDPGPCSSAVEVWRRIAHTVPAGHRHRAAYLSSLGLALMTRYGHTGDLADLDEAVDRYRAAVEATPADHPDRALELSNLGLALRDRFGRTGHLTDLDQAVDCLRAAVEVTAADHPDRSVHLSNLATALRSRFERIGHQADLDEAIACLQAALEATATDHPGRAIPLSNLATALQSRFKRTGDPADLDRSVTAGRDAVRATPTGHPDRPAHLNNLGLALQNRFERTGDLADLDEAVDRHRAAVEATPAGHRDRVLYLNNLGSALHARFGRTGDQPDLDEAVGHLRETVRHTPAGHPARARHLNNLGLAMVARFKRTGDQADLDEAVDHLRETVRDTPADHPARADHLSNLGSVLQERFERTGDRADLDEAVDRYRAAVEATPADHPDRALYLNNLGIALQARFVRTGDRSDLDEAVTIGQAAVETLPADHPSRALYLSNLGGALQERFGRTGDRADADEAIERHRAAVEAAPTDHPRRAMYLNHLGHALRGRSERTGDRADLDRAVAAGRAAVEATPADHPERATHLSGLGASLRARFRHTGDRADLDAAVSALTGAWEVASAAPSPRIHAARAVAGLLAETEPGRAADAAEAAVRLLPEAAPRRLERGDQQYALGGFAGLAGDAAALALADPRGSARERATRALRLLEAGRAVLLGQALDARGDLTQLTHRHPDLAARFVRLRDRIDQPSGTAGPTARREEAEALAARPEHAVRDRHRLAREFAETLAEIRSLDGFASFALPPATEELLAEADQGPVVVFNISGYRSDALLLTRDGIFALELPRLTADAVTETVTSFRQALRTATSGESREQRREAQAVMSHVLEWLWDAAAGPVLEALGHHRRPPSDTDWPRVWWAPGGLLGLLPLAAAGHHTDPADDPARRTVMDRVVSSHTPTVRALRHARRHTPVPAAPARALVVAMPTTPGLPDRGRLPHVGAEVATLHRHLPDPVVLLEPDSVDGGSHGLPDRTPTKDNVLGHLPDCSIVHFACHGASDPTDPSKSLLLLHDHAGDPLTVASLAPVRLDRAQLAYLSACRTAAVDAAGLTDEAIHLTSAFQLAGFPHVVGTLWEIDDGIAVTVADSFYAHLRTPDGTIDTGRAARALHQAVRGVRDGHDLPGQVDRTRIPFLWAAYLHAGA
ncbi:CHAT domain-containing protein [Streptomyces sp. NPDC085946]|uniref:CHAT domain-containing protein n=1 Tax=Streptomyces sp. NPDC085946 TaxID=3365744 RepID=UPI0037D46C20